MTKEFEITGAGAYLTDHQRFDLGFGNASKDKVPKLVYWVDVQLPTGETARGIASDFAMVGWFDKAKAADHENDFLDAIKEATRNGVNSIKHYYNTDHAGKLRPFAASKERGDYYRDMASKLAKPTTKLATQMIYALEERAIWDAVARAMKKNTPDLFLERNGFDLNQYVPGVGIGQILRPSNEYADYIPIRHTVGHKDSIRRDEERKDKPNKLSLESYMDKIGVNKFKVKITTDDLNDNFARLKRMAALFKEKNMDQDPEFLVTLDGNESFADPQDLIKFAETYTSDPDLAIMATKTKYIEQPFTRDSLENLDEPWRKAFRRLQELKLSLLIDESGDTLESYPKAIESGVLGGGMKMCKGMVHGFTDAAHAIQHGGFNSAEDLTVAEFSDLLPAINVYVATRTISDGKGEGPSGKFGIESNGWAKTPSGLWLDMHERNRLLESASDFYGEIFEAGLGYALEVKVDGKKGYPTRQLKGPGLGGPDIGFKAGDHRARMELLAKV